MFCRECGHGVKNHAEVCPNCGVRPLNSKKYCQSCGSATNENQEMCVQCGSGLKYSGGNSIASSEDNPSGLLNLAVCCFPIVGVILYFIWKNEKPKSARAVCTWAIVGFSIGIVLYIAAVFLGMMSEMMYY